MTLVEFFLAKKYTKIIVLHKRLNPAVLLLISFLSLQVIILPLFQKLENSGQ
jgi:hypothetical protein